MLKFSNYMKVAVQAALEAGNEILKIYSDDNFDIEIKSDNSPLTIADKISHKTIVNKLETFNYHILSEEGSKIPYEERKKWDKFWMIDPIDGTKEFINKNGEFTINISLMIKNYPTLGVVYVPVHRELYMAQTGFGSFKLENIKDYSDINLNKLIDLNKSKKSYQYTVVVSRSHMNIETKKYVQQKKILNNDLRTVSFGSSLKICKVAEGFANCYPRFGHTMEWDTAAAHIISELAGCTFLKTDGTKFKYNKESLLNPYFIVEKL